MFFKVKYHYPCDGVGESVPRRIGVLVERGLVLGALKVEWVERVHSRLVARAVVESALGVERVCVRERALRVERGLVESAVVGCYLYL